MIITLITMLVLILSLIAVTVLAFVDPEVFPQNQHYVIIPLLIFWLFLFRNTPKLAFQFQQDLKQHLIETIEGVAVVHNKPGFRVLFPLEQQLSVKGISVDLRGFPQEKCHIGCNVRVRYLQSSKLLLSVEAVEAEVETHSSDKLSALLTEIELSIVRLMADGNSDKIIARKLNLEPATIRTYNSTLYRKLDVKSRKQAAEKARELGLLNVN
ncbi:MAG: response regulator transcription factor [Gammaproteobacteria bacterium]|nr:response regulator transcription factor [Gammaproteobacteria bacterium]